MHINKISEFLNAMGLGRKVEKVRAPSTPDVQINANTEGEISGISEEGDSVSISLEGVIKETAMKIKHDLPSVRNEKIAQLKEEISSGQYQVSPEDVARAIIEGRVNNQEEI